MRAADDGRARPVPGRDRIASGVGPHQANTPDHRAPGTGFGPVGAAVWGHVRPATSCTHRATPERAGPAGGAQRLAGVRSRRVFPAQARRPRRVRCGPFADAAAGDTVDPAGPVLLGRHTPSRCRSAAKGRAAAIHYRQRSGGRVPSVAGVPSNPFPGGTDCAPAAAAQNRGRGAPRDAGHRRVDAVGARAVGHLDRRCQSARCEFDTREGFVDGRQRPWAGGAAGAGQGLHSQTRAVRRCRTAAYLTAFFSASALSVFSHEKNPNFGPRRSRLTLSSYCPSYGLRPKWPCLAVGP